MSDKIEKTTDLYKACVYGDIDLVKFLFENKLIDKETIDNNKNPPLHIACRDGNYDIVKYLITVQNSNLKTIDNKGFTPIILVSDAYIKINKTLNECIALNYGMRDCLSKRLEIFKKIVCEFYDCSPNLHSDIKIGN